MNRELDIDGQRWTVMAMSDNAEHRGSDPWHYSRVRFESAGSSEGAPRETWLRCEEDVAVHDVLDQYDDEALIEAFLVAEEV